MIISASVQGGQLDAGEAGMLRGVFHLHEQEARQVMTPIPAVVTVDTSEDVETALRRCVETGHTRLLVTEEENPDRVRGIVHVNSLSRTLLNQGREASLEPPELEILHALQRRQPIGACSRQPILQPALQYIVQVDESSRILEAPQERHSP